MFWFVGGNLNAFLFSFVFKFFTKRHNHFILVAKIVEY